MEARIGERTAAPVAAGAPGAEPGTASPTLVPGRDRYLDLLRSLALLRVVAYHALGLAWLSWAFPAMGVMFAVAGSLTAKSLLGRPAADVLLARSRRLLLPLWVYSAAALTLIFLAGWDPLADGVGWGALALWFLPVGVPPVPEELGFFGVFDTDWAEVVQVILWYIRTYFWLLLVSPLLLRAFRRAPRLTMAAPLLISVVLNAGGVDLPFWAASPVTDFSTYASYWLLGFSHRLGLLQRVRLRVVVLLGLVAMALGMAWALANLGGGVLDMNDFPLGQALWSLGFSALLLRVSPSWQRLPKSLAFLDPVVTLTSNRALTIYLWHYLLVLCAHAVVDVWSANPVLVRSVPWLLNDGWTVFLLDLLFVGAMVFAVGWVEDVAARRWPRVWPDGTPPGPRARLGASLQWAVALSTLAALAVWWYSSYFWALPTVWAAARVATIVVATALLVALAIHARSRRRRLLGTVAVVVTLLCGHGVVSVMSDITDASLPLRQRAAQIGDELGFTAQLPADRPIRLDAGEAPVTRSDVDALVVDYDAFTVTESAIASPQGAEDMAAFVEVEEGRGVIVDDWRDLVVRGEPAIAVEWRDRRSGSLFPHRVLVFQDEGVVVRMEAWPQGERPMRDDALTFNQLERAAASFEPVGAGR
ncbi:MAG: acyltransferase family protein [Actinomycetes bacterium]